MVMNMTTAVQPYQQDDFVMEGEKKVGYKGPVFRVRYPVNCDMMQEMHTWASLGYETSSSTWHIEMGGGLLVYGDIPQFAQKNLERVGVRVETVKERGPTVPYPFN